MRYFCLLIAAAVAGCGGLPLPLDDGFESRAAVWDIDREGISVEAPVRIGPCAIRQLRDTRNSWTAARIGNVDVRVDGRWNFDAEVRGPAAAVTVECRASKDPERPRQADCSDVDREPADCTLRVEDAEAESEATLHFENAPCDDAGRNQGQVATLQVGSRTYSMKPVVARSGATPLFRGYRNRHHRGSASLFGRIR